MAACDQHATVSRATSPSDLHALSPCLRRRKMSPTTDRKALFRSSARAVFATGDQHAAVCESRCRVAASLDEQAGAVRPALLLPPLKAHDSPEPHSPPVTIAAARAKNLWLMVPANEVEDRRLAATAMRPSRNARRIVRVENKREISVGRFGAMSSNSWWKIEILTSVRAAVRKKRTSTSQSVWARIVCSYKTLE